MTIDGLDMKYVIGFPMQKKNVLLIKRNKHPWVNKWNGPGGKIERGENPLQAIYREILEETTIDLGESKTTFTGVVTWDIEKEPENNTGMYTFISDLSINQSLRNEERITREGILAWKPLAWVCNKENKEVADNIPYFLPLMIDAKNPQRYHCIFRNKKLIEVKALPLPKGITLPWSLE